MGTFCMDMSSYEIERVETTSSDYGDEVLCAVWIPALALHHECVSKAAMPVGLMNADIDLFLRKMYACQR